MANYQSMHYICTKKTIKFACNFLLHIHAFFNR